MTSNIADLRGQLAKTQRVLKEALDHRDELRRHQRDIESEIEKSTIVIDALMRAETNLEEQITETREAFKTQLRSNEVRSYAERTDEVHRSQQPYIRPVKDQPQA